MMSGYITSPTSAKDASPRTYEVVARKGGWSVRLKGACTRPFDNREAAKRIALHLQRLADGLNHTDYAARRCGARASVEGL